MIKCIVCDLDGTLIKLDDTIEEKTYQLLKLCQQHGIEFMIATGRDINMVNDLLDKYDFDCELILNNGAQYCDRHMTFNEIYPMDNQSFLDVVHILHDYGYLLAIHTNNGKYSLHNADDFWDYHMKLLHASLDYRQSLPKKTFTIREKYLRDFHYVKDPQEILDQGVKVLKIDARHLDSSVQGVKKQLSMPHLDISSSYDDNIEITADRSNKGLLLKKVIEKKGCQNDEVAVFGDGENDCHMLSSFQHSFAPSNASESAKKAAHYSLQLTFDTGAVYEGLQMLIDKGLIQL